ncbi:MAG: hypothetical protein ABIG68_13085, partial [Acidobacteriota bacterium]
MKKAALSVLILLLIAGSAAIAAAQGQTQPPPPPCCGEEGLTPIRVPAQPLPGTAAAGLQVETSDDALRALGMTRLDFVDRVAALFFQDRAVEFLVPVTRQADPRYFALPSGR